MDNNLIRLRESFICVCEWDNPPEEKHQQITFFKALLHVFLMLHKMMREDFQGWLLQVALILKDYERDMNSNVVVPNTIVQPVPVHYSRRNSFTRCYGRCAWHISFFSWHLFLEEHSLHIYRVNLGEFTVTSQKGSEVSSELCDTSSWHFCSHTKFYVSLWEITHECIFTFHEWTIPPQIHVGSFICC